MAETRIIVNHLGFAADSAKHFVVINPPAEQFQVISRMTKDPVLDGRLERVAGDLGDGWVGCFTPVRGEGTYLIRCGDAESRVVTVWSKVYDYPRRVLLNYFVSQRCGDTPLGWNSPCHVRDAKRVDTGEHLDVTGGWHQSGDLRKWTFGTSYGIVGLCRTLNTQQPPWDEGGMTGEIRWGNQYFHKMVRPDGGLMDHVILPLGWDPERDLYPNDAPHSTLFQVIGGQALAAQVFRTTDPAYSERCIEVARRIWGYATDPALPAEPYNPPVIPKHHEWLTSAFTQSYPGSCLHWMARAFAALALHDATEDAAWLEEACRAASETARLQVGGDVHDDPASACFRVAADRPDYVCAIGDSVLGKIALCDLLALAPDHPDAPLWSTAVRNIAEQYRLMAGANPWGLVPSYWYADETKGSRPAGSGYYRYFFRVDTLIGGVNFDALANALFLLRAARLFDEDAYRAAAFRQLDWVLGCNPMDTSTVEGIGLNQPERFINPREFFPPTPQIPGAAMTGITGDEHDEPALIGCAKEYDMPPTALLLWLLTELNAGAYS
jgi:Glycosyl hydrolase family 9/Cellulase N-terminal ig-like domain